MIKSSFGSFNFTSIDDLQFHSRKNWCCRLCLHCTSTANDYLWWTVILSDGIKLRLAHLGISEAVRIYPALSLKVFLGLTPPHFHIEQRDNFQCSNMQSCLRRRNIYILSSQYFQLLILGDSAFILIINLKPDCAKGQTVRIPYSNVLMGPLQ